MSNINGIRSIGLASTRLVNQEPCDGIIHDICVIGKLDNKTFIEVLAVRDEISNSKELPIAPLPVNDDDQFEIVWTR